MAINKKDGGVYGPTPQLIRPGVMYRETDFIGNADVIALSPEEYERARKGDLSMAVIPGFESRALSHPGLPFALKPGKGEK